MTLNSSFKEVASVPSRRIIYLLQCIVVSWWPGVMAHDNLRGGREGGRGYQGGGCRMRGKLYTVESIGVV